MIYSIRQFESIETTLQDDLCRLVFLWSLQACRPVPDVTWSQFYNHHALNNHPALKKSQERKWQQVSPLSHQKEWACDVKSEILVFCAPRFSQLQSSSTLHTQDRVFFSRPPRLIIPTQLQQPRHQEIEMCVPDQAIHGWTCMLSCYNALGFKILKMPKSPQLTKQIQGKMAEIWWGYRVIVRRSQRLPWSSGERLD